MNTATRSGAARVQTSSSRSAVQRLGHAAVLVSVGSIFFSSLYMGLASCGAYAWHQHALFGANIALYIAALTLPSTSLPSLKYKLLFAVGLPVLAFVLAAAATPFYPSQPQSMAEYWATFLNALRFGACG